MLKMFYLKMFHLKMFYLYVLPQNSRAPITLTDADNLKFLINLVGDMHQPLHFTEVDENIKGPISNKEDLAGYKLKVGDFGGFYMKILDNASIQNHLFRIVNPDFIFMI